MRAGRDSRASCRRFATRACVAKAASSYASVPGSARPLIINGTRTQRSTAWLPSSSLSPRHQKTYRLSWPYARGFVGRGIQGCVGFVRRRSEDKLCCVKLIEAYLGLIGSGCYCKNLETMANHFKQTIRSIGLGRNIKRYLQVIRLSALASEVDRCKRLVVPRDIATCSSLRVIAVKLSDA